MKRNTKHLPTVFFSANAWALAMLYLVFSVGVIKATHFCMGSEASVAYFTTDAKGCACNASPEVATDDCCHEQYDLLKINDVQKKLSVFELKVPAFTLLSFLYLHMAVSETGSAASFDTEGPARFMSLPPLFELFCSLIFYDISPAA
jgi:hypothetical protein